MDPEYQEGAVAEDGAGNYLVYRRGEWYPADANGAPLQPIPRPDYGPGAVELPNGIIQGPRGPQGGQPEVLFRPGTGATGGGVGATPEQRGRIAIGLPNALAAELRLSAMEQGMVDDQGRPIAGATPGAQRRNWFNEDWGASLIDRMGDSDGAQTRGPIASAIGGADYQLYDQSVRSIEAAFLPILSGAAVTDPEAQRFIRANLPAFGDGPEVLAEKALNRQRMLNAAAAIMGEELPFPELGLFSGMVTAYEEANGLTPGTLEGRAAELGGAGSAPTGTVAGGPTPPPEGGLPRNPDGTLRDGPVNLQQIIEGVAPEDRPSVLMRLGLREGDEIIGADGDVEVLVSTPRLAESADDTAGTEIRNGVAYRQLDADALRDASRRSDSTPDVLRSLTQGASYNFSDEIDAFGAGLETRIGGWFGNNPGYTPDEANAAVRFTERREMDEFARDRPVTDFGLRLGGGFAAPGMLGMGRWSVAPVRSTGAARALPHLMTRGAAVGAGTGAAYGAGGAQDGQRFEGAMTGAGYGAPLGAAAPVAGRVVGAGVNRVTDFIRNLRPGNRVGSAAASMTGGRSGADMAAAADEMRSFGAQPTFADVASDRGRGTIRVAAARSDGARDEAVAFGRGRRADVQDYAAGLGERISPINRSPAEIDEVLQQYQRQASAPAFGAVRGQSIALDPDSVQALRAPLARSSVRDAAQLMASSSDPAEREAAVELMRLADDLLDRPGEVRITVGAADLISRYLSRAGGSDANAQRVFSGLGRAVRDNARGQSGGYDQALRGYAERAALADSAAVGESFLGRGNSRDFVRMVGGMTDPQRQTVAAAGRAQVEQATSTPAGAAGVLDRLAVGRGQGERMTALLGPQRAGEVRRGAEIGRQLVETGRQVSPRTGSETFLNATDDQALDGVGAMAGALRRPVTQGIPMALDWLRSRAAFSQADAEALVRLSLDPNRIDEAIALASRVVGQQNARRLVMQELLPRLTGPVTGARDTTPE